MDIQFNVHLDGQQISQIVTNAGDIRQKWREQEESRKLRDIKALLIDALTADGARHKQWYLWEIAAKLGIDLTHVDAEEGIEP